MEKVKYIHYGHTEFDPELFMRPHNERMFTKPYGGLWGSRIDAKCSWKHWCECEHFRDCCEDNSFTFTLTEDANVLHICSVVDLQDLPKVDSKSFDYTDWCCLDFERLLAYGVDAVELHLSEDYRLYWSMYGWDCDSILIMNPEVVVV